jgi:squalene-hopene/tetraprenyl-beta-curcumene cyclase
VTSTRQAQESGASTALPAPTVSLQVSSDQPAKLRSLLQSAWNTAHEMLRTERLPAGHWAGELSTSALSTATAISALSQVRLSQSEHEQAVELDESRQMDMAIGTACRWLVQQQNQDGGFGDTHRSHSNIATTLLVLAAWELARQAMSRRAVEGERLETWWPEVEVCQPAAWKYVEGQGKWEGLRRRYGKDKTFVVPILTNCALAGLVSWDEVPALPFEAAWLPQELYRWARMPVVSYAVPALVAIGQARFHFVPPKNRLLHALRTQALQPTLRVLRTMQPTSGGYLEATPLTSFVLMSLAAVGNGHLPVARACLKFILDARLADGSWPIDTNLATWVTSLSMHAVATQGAIRLSCEASDESPLVTPRSVRWLLSCQHRQRHPFTGANPGGWGWTNLSGAVPDADDTPAALMALSQLDLAAPAWHRLQQQTLEAVGLGLNWLLRLQNRDGGWPTFCKGWGKLPFDRSGTDLTAHALRAFHAWLPRLEEVQAACSDSELAAGVTLRSRRIGAAIQRGLAYLERSQQADGSWLPLWFGNQDRAEEDNPIYGTGKVLMAFGALGLVQHPCARRGIVYLQSQQNADGGWGGGDSVDYVGVSNESSSTIEETAIALEGLMCSGQSPYDASIMQALDWLACTIQSGNLSRSWPIGFYFAKLWYHERLYPAIFSLGALGTALALTGGPLSENHHDLHPSP